MNPHLEVILFTRQESFAATWLYTLTVNFSESEPFTDSRQQSQTNVGLLEGEQSLDEPVLRYFSGTLEGQADRYPLGLVFKDLFS